MALVCGPADDRDNAAKSVCSFYTACYHTCDFQRAGSWTALLHQQGMLQPTPGPGAFVSSHCESVQAALLIELGRWSEAEQVLERARRDFEAVMPGPSRHPDLALAELRINQGRLAEAEELLVGRDQFVQALIPTARLHLARGDHDLAVAAARRGLRVVADDRVRAVALLVVLVDAELARGGLEAARAACDDLARRTADLDVPALRARAVATQAHVMAAEGNAPRAIELLEQAVDRVDAGELPWLRAQLLVDLCRYTEQAGDLAGARLAAGAAAAALADLDVVLPSADVEVVDRSTASQAAAPKTAPVAARARLAHDGRWWEASFDGASVRLPDTKGLRYVAELVGRPGVERHVLDLVDRVEGVDSSGVDRRVIGDAGPLLDSRARNEYRHRIEALRSEIDDALELQDFDTAERRQAELDGLVGELARAFGLGNRSRAAASASERARLNVTRAVRAATTKLADALPHAGAALDRHVRTGTYCVYQPVVNDVEWIVQS
jgi:tetratricopeptide (TPR) repeat protein